MIRVSFYFLIMSFYLCIAQPSIAAAPSGSPIRTGDGEPSLEVSAEEKDSKKDQEDRAAWHSALEKRIAAGGWGSALRLADEYAFGDLREKEAAFCIYHECANVEGSYYAQYRLGYCYYYGVGTAINRAEAACWYYQAAKADLDVAQCSLAICFELGAGIKQDLAKAAYWYGRAAEQGYPQALYNLASFYIDGLGGVKKDHKRALELMIRSAELKFEPAEIYLDRLGIRYR